MSNVRIVYCQVCSFMSRAIELADQLLLTYGTTLNKKFSVTLEASDAGIFDVYVDGTLVFSRGKAGRLPGFEEIRLSFDRERGST